MSLADNIKNANTLNGRRSAKSSNAPAGTGQMEQYFADSTRSMVSESAKYATDYFGAQVQGLNTSDFNAIEWYKIRAAAILSNSSITGNMQDSWKQVFFERPDITYIPRGTKLWFFNNVWLAYNPNNVAAIVGSSVCRQCNAIWKRRDYYGKVISEPFVIDKLPVKSNANSYDERMVNTNGFVDCIMQRNALSKDLNDNTRIILGSSAFAVRGLNDFAREFTDDADSVKLMFFSLYKVEPDQNDDMDNGIAGGNAFQWTISISGPKSMMAGSDITLSAGSLKNGTVPEKAVSYVWQSGDNEVATVNASSGIVHGVSPGTVTIYCYLEQNPDIVQTVTIEVAESSSDEYLAFNGTVPEKIVMFSSMTLSAALYKNGLPTEEEVSFALSGVDSSYYAAEFGNNSITITCISPSEKALIIKASSGTNEISAEIRLTSF